MYLLKSDHVSSVKQFSSSSSRRRYSPVLLCDNQSGFIRCSTLSNLVQCLEGRLLVWPSDMVVLSLTSSCRPYWHGWSYQELNLPSALPSGSNVLEPHHHVEVKIVRLTFWRRIFFLNFSTPCI